MGTVMLAAFLEWFLWLAAFLYCLIKVFQKADHWSTRVLAVLIMILFTALRSEYYPVQTRGVANNSLQSDFSTSHGCHLTLTATDYSVFS